MADNQVLSVLTSAREILPEARECVPEQQEAACQENQRRCQVLQECGSGYQNPQGSNRI